MNTRQIEKINGIIDLFDRKILETLRKDELDIGKLSTLSSVKRDYIKELDNLIRVNNTNELFNKKYKR